MLKCFWERSTFWAGLGSCKIHAVLVKSIDLLVPNSVTGSWFLWQNVFKIDIEKTLGKLHLFSRLHSKDIRVNTGFFQKWTVGQLTSWNFCDRFLSFALVLEKYFELEPCFCSVEMFLLQDLKCLFDCSNEWLEQIFERWLSFSVWLKFEQLFTQNVAVPLYILLHQQWGEVTEAKPRSPDFLLPISLSVSKWFKLQSWFSLVKYAFSPFFVWHFWQMLLNMDHYLRWNSTKL